MNVRREKTNAFSYPLHEGPIYVCIFPSYDISLLDFQKP